MDEDYGYEFDEGSDIDNWEDEQVFQDHEGREDEGGPLGDYGYEEGEREEWEEPDYDYNRDEAPDYEPREDFGYFGEMGMMEE